MKVFPSSSLIKKTKTKTSRIALHLANLCYCTDCRTRVKKVQLCKEAAKKAKRLRASANKSSSSLVELSYPKDPVAAINNHLSKFMRDMIYEWFQDDVVPRRTSKVPVMPVPVPVQEEEEIKVQDLQEDQTNSTTITTTSANDKN